MMTRKKHTASSVATLFLAFCICFTFIFSVPAFAEDGENTVRAETNAIMAQGASGYCYVYIDSLAGISSLDVTVFFDPDTVEVQNTYNGASAILYDSSVSDNSVHFTYIFDGNGAESKSLLFYFYYIIKTTAKIGKTDFTVMVADAYDASLSPVEISGSKTGVLISEQKVSQTGYLYGSSSVSTSVQEEFELSYRVSTNQIASGSFVIHYDDELFELVSATAGRLLEGKISDINTSLAGAVYVSFAANEYNPYTDLLSIKLKTKKNVSAASKVRLEVTDFYDLDLCPILCQPVTTNVTVAYDDSYFDDVPGMTLSAEFDDGQDQCTLLITLDADSHLGAGDFALSFDPASLSLVSAEKLFAPTFFTVNDKLAENGIVKFSIISTSDITEQTSVIKMVFSVADSCDTSAVSFDFGGSLTTDSMTNPILLNYILPATYFWNGDQCTAEKRDSFHTETETVTGIYVKDTDATCTENEKGHYEATFTNAAFAKQTTEKDSVEKADTKLGHSYGTVTYKWNGDKCTAERVCTHDGSHKETETVTGTFATDTDATCTTNAKGHYEATFTNAAFAKQTTEKDSVEKEGTMIPYIVGDLDGDENVSTKDAIRLLYHIFYGDDDDYAVNQPCDYNGDGTINTQDAIYLLYYVFYPEDYPLATGSKE